MTLKKKKNSKTLNKRQSLHWEAEQGERNVDGATLRKKLFCELLTYCTNTQLCNHVSVLQRWNAPVKKKKPATTRHCSSYSFLLLLFENKQTKK